MVQTCWPCSSGAGLPSNARASSRILLSLVSDGVFFYRDCDRVVVSVVESLRVVGVCSEASPGHGRKIHWVDLLSKLEVHDPVDFAPVMLGSTSVVTEA